MSQYYASIRGNRGQATRMGTKNSGMAGHIRGWHIGCRVWMRWNENTQQDECTIDVTTGSQGYGQSLRLGEFAIVKGKIKRVSK